MLVTVTDRRIAKDQQFDGFRQRWTERPDGVFDGPYLVYWDSGPTLCMRGQYVSGAQQGIWTCWDRTGRLDKQIHFHNDEPIETRTAPPWFDDAADQAGTDNSVRSSPTQGS